MGDGISENGGDRVGGVIDDARVALKLVTKAVIIIGQESPGLVKRSEDLIGVLTGALIALRAGTEPEPCEIDLQPRCTTPPSVAQPVHEWTLDREDAPLPARCCRRDTPRLADERVAEAAEVDLEGW
jgi:hypothetical protein